MRKILIIGSGKSSSYLIKYLLDKSEKDLSEMGARGRKLIESKYLWNKTTQRTIDLYDWVLNGGQTPDFII